MVRVAKGAISVALVLLVAPALAGCLSPNSSQGSGSDDNSPDRIGDRLPGGETGTGDLLGTLTCDDGHPIPDVNVRLVELDLVATTDAIGDFEFANLPPGAYTLRFMHDLYKTRNETITIIADKLTVWQAVLTPIVPVDYEASRPHAHDYWGNRSQLTLFAGSVDWGSSTPQGGTTDPLCAEANFGLLDVGANCWAVEFWLGEETAPDGVTVVPPGTKELVVNITWQSAPANPPDLLVFFGRKGANQSGYSNTPITNGNAVKLKVPPGATDHGHQQFSLWQFQIWVQYVSANRRLPQYICIDQYCGNEVRAKANPTAVIQQTMAPFGVSIVATRADEQLPLEPAHPRWWAAGTKLTLANTNTSLRALEYPSTPTALTCTKNATACFTLPDDTIVPPGTTRLLVNLTYRANDPNVEALAKDLFEKKRLLFRTAAINPRDATFDQLRSDAPATSAWGNATWSLALGDAKQADAVYEKHSLWLFLLVNEGSETSNKFANDCPSVCEGITYELTVEAFNDAWKPEAC